MGRRALYAAFSALVVSIVLSFTACGSRQVRTEHKGIIISLTDSILEAGGTDTIRFGRLRQGEIARLRIWFENDTKKPVVISGYERSCGCTALDYKSEPIAAGESQQVALTFDSRGEWGWQLKTMDISFAGEHRALRLLIEAEVE